MALTKVSGNLIQANTITATNLAPGVGGGAIIANVQIANSTWGLLDDTAVDTSGGYVVINGSGFTNTSSVIIGSVSASAVEYVSDSQLRVTVPSQNAGSYSLYVVQDTGATSIRVNALTYSGFPTWVTGTTLDEQSSGAAIAIQLEANGATTYTLQDGSSLPPNTSLGSNGYFSGTVSIENQTTYTFTVEATDAENQNSPRAFSVTVTVGEPYFYTNSLLISADGTNNANNNSFVDSSTNAFTITRNGNPTQGSFSPFSRPDGRWSVYFDGVDDYLSIPNNTALQPGSGDFTVEFWAYNTDTAAAIDMYYASSTSGISIYRTSAGKIEVAQDGIAGLLTGTTTVPINQWNHIAIVRNGTTLRIYLNGVQDATTTNSTNFNGAGTQYIGTGSTSSYYWPGYLSNFRLVKGTAVYTAAFTPSVSPLTAIANTSLLTCQSNRFKDNSTNAFAITVNGNPSVQVFNPFNPAAAYSTSTNGGSGYFDGSGDYLTVPSNTVFTFGTGDWTIEFWINLAGNQSQYDGVYDPRPPATTGIYPSILFDTGNVLGLFVDGSFRISSSALILNQWYHVAVARSGTSTKMFINGVQAGSTYTDNNNYLSSTVNIGTLAYSSGYDFNGYISGLRIVKGTAVYTSAFTPPTAPVTSISGTSLLLNFTNGGIFDAAASNVLETAGNAKLSTSVKKYGSASMYFDGTGDYIYLRPGFGLPFTFGTGNFTIEFWWYPTTLASAQALLYHTDNSTVPGGHYVIVYNTSLGLRFYTNGGSTGSVAQGATTGWSTNTWYHVAVVRNGSTLTIYRDGTSIASGTNSNTLGGASLPSFIGGETLEGNYCTGYIDDFRVSKGYARYTANFTPPTSAHKLN